MTSARGNLTTLALMEEMWPFRLMPGARLPIEIPDVSRDVDLPLLFREAGFHVGVEVGVEQGVYAELLCQVVPGLKLHAVDCWQAYSGYRDHVNQEKLDGFYEATLKRTALYDVEVIRDWSVEAAKEFDAASVDFVYLDANHDFANVVKDLAAWAPKVRRGGVVAGHDYILRKNKAIMHHVVQAVRGWTECYGIDPWFLLGRKARVEGEVRDDNRSWMWVR